jgi:hypothetical protein
MTASPMTAGDLSEPVPPALVLERVLRRGRLSVAFRLLLALPHFVLLYVMSLVAGILAFLGWFAALVTGRLPAAFAQYLCQFLAYATSVLAYVWLLTDRYPPFWSSEPGYPVEVGLWPGRLNRLAVLFRLLLVIPAEIVLTLALVGWAVLSFFIWLLVLVSGRVPGALFDAVTALLRYYLRFYAYAYMVTAAYPWGLFGDRPSPAPVAAPQEAFTAPTETVAPPAAASSGAATATLPGPAEGLEPAPAQTPAPPGPAAPRGLLVLSGGAKRVIVLFIVLGVALYGGGGALAAISSGGTVSRVQALSRVQAAHDALASEGQKFQQKIATCGSAGDRLGCVQAADRGLADAFETFATKVDGMEFPAAAQAEASDVARLGHRFAGALRELVAAPSIEEYTRLASGTDQIGSSFDQRYQDLVNKLTA